MKNVARYRLGTMLHLDIQKGQESMKRSNFQKDLGGTTACMKRLAISTKLCGRLTPNDTYFTDIWLSSVKTSEQVMAAGVDYCGLVKMSHKSFCHATLENLMENWPGGSYLVMKSTPRVPG